MKYALLRNSDNALLSVSDYQADWSPENVAHKFGPEFEARFVPVLDEDTPEYDTATHHLERNDRLEDGQWKRGFLVVENPVPPEVPLWALREVCEDTVYGQTNLKAAIEAAIETLPAAARRKARNRWSTKPTIRRNEPLTLQIVSGLQLDAAVVDSLFKQAALLA